MTRLNLSTLIFYPRPVDPMWRCVYASHWIVANRRRTAISLRWPASRVFGHWSHSCFYVVSQRIQCGRRLRKAISCQDSRRCTSIQRAFAEKGIWWRYGN